MRQYGITILVIVVFFTAVQIATATQVYFNDFEGAVGPEWSHTTTDTTPLGGRGFLGQFGNDTVSLTLNNLPEFTDISVSFELFVIRSWDGNDIPGPDIWDLSIQGGPTLLHTTFSNWCFQEQAYPGTHPGGSFPWHTGAAEINTLGYKFLCLKKDSVYDLNLTSPHSGNSLTLDFTGSGLQCCIFDESWGLDNVRVAVTAIPEPASIILVGAAIAGLAAFARKQMRKVKR